MNVIIAGMKRQVHEDKESVNSNIEENVRIEQDFFDDWILDINSMHKHFFVWNLNKIR